MAEPWQRTDFAKKGGGNQRADARTERALKRLKLADRRRAAGWHPDDGSHVPKPGTRMRVGKVNKETGGVTKTGWRGKIDINKQKPGEPIPKGETQITKGGKNVEVNPTQRKTPSRIKPKAGKPPGYYTREIETLKKDILPDPIKKVKSQGDTVTNQLDKFKKSKVGVIGKIAGIGLGVLAAYDEIAYPGERKNPWERLFGPEVEKMKKKIPKQSPRELGPKKGRRNGPCPSMTRKGKTLYARDGSRCGRRAATVRGPTRGYD